MACGQACRNTLDENIRVLLEGHPATTGDLPVQQVPNVDLLDVAVIGDPIVPAFAPDPSGQGRIRPLGIAGNGMFSFYVASPPASRSKSATAPGRSARTGTTAAATTASAPGATSSCARSQPQDHRREARQHQRPSRPRPRGEIADIAKLSSGRFGPELMTMTWRGPLPASACVTTSPRAGSSSGAIGRRRP